MGEKMKVSLVYISLSGNTESFVRRLSDYLLALHPDIEVEQIPIKDMVKEGQPFFEMANPFIAFLPTYLEGGNGVDNGDVEILTTDVADFIAYGDNASKCLGIVGSGNRNFNNQYCLTAKQYSERFGFPVLADFEMRGMLGDIKKVAGIIEDLYGIEKNESSF
ncbi:class Ib ribonucleoside-diphosphate reductase assembly flavoprotein NrdI [Streptococcus sp. DD11]|uniref:class Ib ribonucleoside-diphosphate reductase assembly flavoprotein NrdI n=1 Tax=Streptococcus sp. DD11 TaxID=1777879 RepID=UPI0010086131|nr:class Ib ribonucleoside-diphosphate reductase assembly flavoprotein NrdI [Streptococcus sp. DD11]